MAVVFFVGIFLLVVLILLIFSNISFYAEKVQFSNKAKIKLDYTIYFELKILGKINILKISITPQKIERAIQKFNVKEKLNKVDWRDLKTDLPNRKELKQMVKKLEIDLKSFHLTLKLGTEDVIITSFAVMLISSVLGIIFAKYIKYYEKEKYSYEILPVYQNQNAIKLVLDCVIQVKILSMIKALFYFIKTRKRVKQKGREKYKQMQTKKNYGYSYK